MKEKVMEPSMQHVMHIVSEAVAQHESKIIKEITRLFESNTKTEQYSYRSVFVHELYTALSKAQGQYKEIGYNRKDTYYADQYADIHTIRLATKDALVANGLSWNFLIMDKEDGTSWLMTMLFHNSGQYVQSNERIVAPSGDDRAYGSTLAFQKRNALMAILGVTVENDIMDDNAAESSRQYRDTKERGTQLGKEVKPDDESRDRVSKEQVQEIEMAIGDFIDIHEDLLYRYKIKTLADLPRSLYGEVVTRARKIHNLRTGLK